jgi:hypothetical protein
MSMAANRMLRTFLRRTAKGEYSLEAEDGSLVLRSRTYRDLRRDMRVVLAALGLRLEDVKVFLGAPPRLRPPVVAPVMAPVLASVLPPVLAPVLAPPPWGGQTRETAASAPPALTP